MQLTIHEWHHNSEIALIHIFFFQHIQAFYYKEPVAESKFPSDS